MRTGLVLGGGGLVGIAWEVGVMAGLGLTPAAVDVAIGSSAGSVAAAQLMLGLDLDDQVAWHSKPRPAGAPAPSAGARPVVPEDIMSLLMSRDGTMEERARAVGKFAADADVALAEDDYVASFRTFLRTDVWPEGDLRITTAEVETGRSVAWTRSDGIDLIRAVASSCAIPGYFPTVSFGGMRYTDGPRGGFLEEMVRSKGLESLLFIGPSGALPAELRQNPEIDALEAAGLPVIQITGEDLTLTVNQLMDPAQRGVAAQMGVASGRARAAEVAALLS